MLTDSKNRIPFLPAFVIVLLVILFFMFGESFLKRFANNVDNTRTYNVKFDDINEVPPKVSVKVDSLTVFSVKGKEEEEPEGAEISQQYDAIIEANYYNDFVVEQGLKNNSDLCKPFNEIAKRESK